MILICAEGNHNSINDKSCIAEISAISPRKWLATRFCKFLIPEFCFWEYKRYLAGSQRFQGFEFSKTISQQSFQLPRFEVLFRSEVKNCNNNKTNNLRPWKDPKPEEVLHGKLLWRTLAEGVRRADSSVAKTLQDSCAQFHFAGRNGLYYHSHGDVTTDVP